jgi:hypothetical protein
MESKFNLRNKLVTPLVTAGLIALSTPLYLANSTIENQTITRPKANIEHILEDKLNIPNADIKLCGNSKSNKTIYIIPQFHYPPNPSYSFGIITEKDIMNCQGEIYKTIEYLHKNKKVDLLLTEGIEGEVTRDRYVNTVKKIIPNSTEKQIKELILGYNKLDAAIGIEWDYGQEIYTVGIDSKKLSDKSIECLNKRNKLEKKLLDSFTGEFTEDKTCEKCIDLDKQYNNLIIEFNNLCSERSHYSAKMTKEYLNKKGFKSGIIVYGGGHEKELVDSLKEYKVYTIELNSYKELNNKLEKSFSN